MKDDVADKLGEACKQFAHCESVLAAYDVVLDDIDDWAGDDWQLVKNRLNDMRADVVEERDRTDAIVQELSLLLNPDGTVRP